MPTRRSLSSPETVFFDDATDRRVQAMIEQAERDIAERDEMRVNLRWGRAQVDMLKRAAALYGVPYQTYLKIVALRAAQDDLQRAAGNEPGEHRHPPAPPTSSTPDDDYTRKTDESVRKVHAKRQHRAGGSQ
jgi:predicted DNA binding CopG/RHH family protein